MSAPQPIEGPPSGPRGRDTERNVREIDWVKGLAILGVVAIHAKVLEGSLVYSALINRSVYVFVVLFGITCELWWQKHAGPSWLATVREWYCGRLVRLVVPVWAVLVVLWTCRVATGQLLVSWSQIAITFAGYLPWVGTGWFVTLVLQLVVLFPFIRVALNVLGPTLSVITSLIVTVACYVHADLVIAVMRYVLLDHGEHVDLSYFYYFWICPLPRVFSIVAGVLIARRALRPSHYFATLATALVCAGVILVGPVGIGAFPAQAIMAVTDIPLTIALLASVRPLRLAPVLATGLAWCGRHSWGLYLGQLLVHEITHLYSSPETSSAPARCGYFLFLLIGGTILVWVGGWLRDRAAAVRDTGILRTQRV